MIKVCPLPSAWYSVSRRLAAYGRTHVCRPAESPVPLILSGWNFSSDVEKKARWDETVAWALNNQCPELVEVAEEDFYSVVALQSMSIGPTGKPMLRPWNFGRRHKPTSTELSAYLDRLRATWRSVAGDELARVSRPLLFSGRKARRLVVGCDQGADAPWGSWFQLPQDEASRRLFTRFRSAVNESILPHEVDHIDFIVGR